MNPASTVAVGPHVGIVVLAGLRGIDRHLVVGPVATFDSKTEVFQVDIDVWQDQFIFDESPDDPGHLVAAKLECRSSTPYLHH